MTPTLTADPILAPLASWFELNRRRLPWRARDLDAPHPDPYAVLVSELMLQQTQVATVTPYFERWMARFPDVASLAVAEDDAIHKLWEGLGYYRRARFLRQAACAIAEVGWPKDVHGLGKLPGIGPYTAAALAAIALQQPEPALDGNAFRVLARLLAIREDPRQRAAFLGDWLRPALQAFGPSRITQAVMELGATLCTPRPSCAACPLSTVCQAHQSGLTGSIPAPKVRAAVKEETLWVVAFHAAGQWLLLPPKDSGLLAGLWRWPVLDRSSDPRMDHVAEAPEAYPSNHLRRWKGWTQVYSHRKEAVEPVAIELDQPIEVPGACWMSDSELPTLPMGKRDQKLRDLLEQPALSCADPKLLAELIRRVRTVKA